MQEETEIAGPLCTLRRPEVRQNPAAGQLELNATLAFTERLAGDSRIWVKALDGAGAESGWLEVGRIRIAASQGGPRVTGLRLMADGGTAGFLELDVEDPDGALDIEKVEVILNDRIDFRHACAVDATPSDSFQWLWLSIRPDHGQGHLGAAVAGVQITYTNSQCSLHVGRSSFQIAGNRVRIRLLVEPKSVMAGRQRIFARTRDMAGLQSSWVEGDPWEIAPNPQSRAPEVSLAGNLSARGHFLAVPIRVQDPDSPRDVAAVDLLVGGGPEDPQACWLRYTRRLGRVALRSADNSAWIEPAPGDEQLANLRCSVPADSFISFDSGAARINLGAAFSETFRGMKGVWARATDAAGMDSGWRKLGDFLVERSAANQTPQASSPPHEGRGSIVALTFEPADPDGASDLRAARLLLYSVEAPDRWCLLVHDRLNDVFVLGSDDSAGLQVFPNDGTARENGRCRLLRTEVTTPSRNTLRLRAWIAFRTPMRGPVQLWAQAWDMAGTDTGWHQAGVWVAQLPNQPPVVAAVEPAQGQGTAQEFELTLHDPDGTQDIRTATLTISADGSEINSCRILAELFWNWLSLQGDHPFAGPSQWLPNVRDLRNGQCVIQSMTMRHEEGNLKLRFPLQLLAGLGGTNRITASVTDISGATHTRRLEGSWTVPEPDPNRPPEPVRLERRQSGAQEVVSAVFADPDGYGDLAVLEVRIGDDAPVCGFRYERRTHTFRISSDDGSAWRDAVWGQSRDPLGNSSCSFIPWALQVSGSGTEMTIRLNMTFRQPMPAGASVWMAATDRAGASSGWVKK